MTDPITALERMAVACEYFADAYTGADPVFNPPGADYLCRTIQDMAGRAHTVTSKAREADRLREVIADVISAAYLTMGDEWNVALHAMRTAWEQTND